MNQGENSFYHTTIPLYTIIASAIGITFIIAYRRFYQRKNDHIEQTKEPDTYDNRKIDPNHPPAQFTTKVSNRRCSTGGGVTVP